MGKCKAIQVGSVTVGGGPLTLIAGPCVIEDREMALRTASQVKKICDKLEIPYIFKASYDKANRSAGTSFRGLGLDKGLEVLSEVKKECGVPVLSDIHEAREAEPAAEVLDVLQIPAFLCRQTDLLQAAARTGKPVNVKKGQFMAPGDMRNVIEKIKEVNNDDILLTERGTCFGYNTLVADMRSLVIMSQLGYPVIFDATHSVMAPGGMGTKSGGEREMAPHLARAAAAVGIDGLFLEVHQDPSNALSDAATMLPIDSLEKVLSQVLRVAEATG